MDPVDESLGRQTARDSFQVAILEINRLDLNKIFARLLDESSLAVHESPSLLVDKLYPVQIFPVVPDSHLSYPQSRVS